jgi:putative flippase GtrA
LIVFKKLRNIVFFRFLLIGGLTAFLYYSSIFFFDYLLGLEYFWAITSAYIISTLFHFLANKHFTFKSSSKIKLPQILKYLVVWCLNYLITILVVQSGYYFYRISPYISVLLSLFITTFIGYSASRHWIFNDKIYFL